MSEIDPDLYTPDQWRQMLIAGAQRTGNAARAGVHLLIHTELPGSRVFARNVLIEERADGAGGVVMCAFVQRWNDIEGVTGYAKPADAKLALMAALINGWTGRMRDIAEGMSQDHARLAAEAWLIAAGADDRYDVVAKGAER